MSRKPEMIIDFRIKKNEPDLLSIHGEAIERGGQYKYLGIVLDDQIKGNSNTEMLVKTCNQRLPLFTNFK